MQVGKKCVRKYVQATHARINFIRAKRQILKTHTADEATIDGGIQSQDSVNVSSANLKTESFPTYFVVITRRYLIDICLTSLRNEVYPG